MAAASIPVTEDPATGARTAVVVKVMFLPD
jgi:hypothetical protein